MVGLIGGVAVFIAWDLYVAFSGKGETVSSAVRRIRKARFGCRAWDVFDRHLR